MYLDTFLGRVILLKDNNKKEDITMETNKFSVPNISCGHCVMAIQNELGEMDGVSKVEGDPEKKEVTVDWDTPATLEKITSTLKEINYPAAE